MISAHSTIDFWFTVGSTYTYLTVSRLHDVEVRVASVSDGVPSMPARLCRR